MLSSGQILSVGVNLHTNWVKVGKKYKQAVAIPGINSSDILCIQRMNPDVCDNNTVAIELIPSDNLITFISYKSYDCRISLLIRVKQDKNAVTVQAKLETTIEPEVSVQSNKKSQATAKVDSKSKQYDLHYSIDHVATVYAVDLKSAKIMFAELGYEGEYRVTQWLGTYRENKQGNRVQNSRAYQISL